jgi:putative hydrolase
MQAGGGQILPLDGDLSGADLSDLTSQMMGQMFTALSPMLVSTSAGSMLGHLGQRALGQYDLPIPRSGDEVLVVATSIDAAALEWGVPVDELRLWVLLHELTAHAVLSVAHVRARLEALLLDFASAFRPNTDAIDERFGSITDLNQLQELAETMSDPDVVLSLLRSPAHDLLVPQLDALVAAVLGFVDHTVAIMARGLIASHDTIRDRFRQRWIDVAPADRFMERLLGLQIDGSTLERGDRFISGVVERAGDEGLRRLWADELDLPTAAEVDAPGLWLARIGQSDGEADDHGTGFEVPDDLSGLDDLD